MWMLIGLTVILIGLINWLLNGSFNYWKKRGVPNPPTTPWLGNIGASLTLKKGLGQIYHDIYNQYKNYLYVGLYKVQQPAILVRDVDLIKSVLIKDFANFHDNDIIGDEEIDPISGKNPFVLKGNRWKVIRSYVTKGITSGKIKNMFLHMNSIAKNMTDYLDGNEEAVGKDGLDAKEFAAKYTTDAVASCAFGLEGNSFTDPDSEFRKMGRKLFSHDVLTSLKFLIVFLYPKLAHWLKLKFMPDDVREWFMGILAETIKHREKNNIVRNDYLDLMIGLKSKDLEYEFTDIDVMAQAMTFYGDGFETTSITLSFVLYELALNLEIQKKLQDEVSTILAKSNGEVTYEGVKEMTYMDKIVAETLRKYPPAMFLSKTCTKEFTFPPPNKDGTGKEVVIEEGTCVVISAYSIHHDEEFYPDPEKFDPERFTEENKNSRPKCTYLPFGEGPRMCLGYRFALTQIKAALVAIVNNFDIKLNPKTKPTFEIDPAYFILTKKDGIYLNFYKRNK